jgi:glycosyltransferase involved in cell wall biosynthesis
VHFTMTQQPLLYFGQIVTTTHDLTMLRITRPSRYHPWAHKIGVYLLQFLYWLSHRKSKAVIVPSKFVAGDVNRMHPFTRKKTFVTYEAAEPPLPVDPEPLEGLKKPFIMHVGSPFPHKNLKRLMQAFEKLKAKYPNLKLVLPGKMKKEFLRDFNSWMDENSASDSIIAPGFVTDESLKWLYENAECYVLPSLSEGFGLPGLEAMVHKCPLASSNATCLPEVYEDAAVFFNPEEVDDIADKIDMILSDEELRQKLIKKGLKQVKKYSWSTMAQETHQVYKKVLKNKK